MPTQIASTPVAKGRVAAQIYKEMQQKPSEASKQGARILMSKYGDAQSKGESKV